MKYCIISTSGDAKYELRTHGSMKIVKSNVAVIVFYVVNVSSLKKVKVLVTVTVYRPIRLRSFA